MPFHCFCVFLYDLFHSLRRQYAHCHTSVHLTFFVTSSTLFSPASLNKLAKVTTPETVNHTLAQTPIAMLVL